MHRTREVRHVSITIDRAPDDVYRHVLDVSTWIHWAHGLGTEVERRGAEWVARGGPLGEVRVRVAERNALGVLDHEVSLPDGQTFHNPLRVLPNGPGSELVFSVFRQPGMSDETFRTDARTVADDLAKLKRLLERG